MEFASTREARDYLLEGNSLTAADLEDLKDKFDEDQYLDFKDGAITSSAEVEKGRRTIRRYVSAFANSDGGILVVGVTDRRPRCISGCSRQGRVTLDKWAESLLADMAPMLSPPPRLCRVEHPAGEVLVIAVARAPELFAVIETGQLKYFLRFHQSTLEAPPYLITDLRLGRRHHPVIDLQVRIGQPSPYHLNAEQQIFFYPTAENVGLVTAEQVELGLVSWVVGSGGSINSALRTYLELGVTPNVEGAQWQLRHGVTRPKLPSPVVLAPFGKVEFDPIEGFVYPFHEERINVVAAFYLLSHGSPPRWFELAFACGTGPGNQNPHVEGQAPVKVMDRRARVLISLQ